MKKIIVALVLGMAVSIIVGVPTAGGVLAAPDPVAGCGAGYELMKIRDIIRELADPAFVDVIPTYDKNGDGYLCVKVIPNEGGPPQFDPAFVFFDNKAAGR